MGSIVVGKAAYLKRDRAGDSVMVSGSWVHAEPVLTPDPSGGWDARYWGYDPEGVAQGIDMIVIKGSTGSN